MAALGAALVYFGNKSAWERLNGADTVGADTASADTVDANAVDANVVDANAVPPSAVPRDCLIAIGETISADAFVSDITDSAGVGAVFKETPDFSRLGAQDVVVVLEDRGGNKTELTASLFIFGIKPGVEAEVGTDGVASRNFLVETPGLEAYYGAISISFITGVSHSQLSRIGEYDVVVNANGHLFNSVVWVTDTAAPEASTANRSIWLGKTIDAMGFVTDIQDASEVSAHFKSRPDFGTAGMQEVCVVLEDIWGNAAEFTAMLNIMRDTSPPVIVGAADQRVYVGNSISYRSGVSAYDSADGSVPVLVDSSAVNIYEVGEYEAIYSAVDSSGNSSSVTVRISIIELNTDVVYAMADDILSRITTQDMSQLEKAQRVYNWVRSNLSYTGTAEKTNTIDGAYAGFRTRQGDCFTFYAVSEVLLTRAGVENMRVTRLGGYTSHYWNLINVGTGWYHFDTVGTRGRTNGFMFTSIQAEEYTRILEHQVPNYYDYDKSLYPPVVGDVEEPE